MSTNKVNSENLLSKDGEVYFFQDFLDQLTSENLFVKLMNEIEWQRDKVKVFGKIYETQREVAWYGDADVSYTYSGVTRRSLTWTPTLLEIKIKIEQFTGYAFNACLLNLYHNGTEGMGWHSDDEKELGPEPVIASLSLGAGRDFQFKHKLEDLKMKLYLNSGSLLIMKGKTQSNWKHALPKRMKLKEARINLTFRRVLSSGL